MKPKLILHAGAPETGASAIRAFATAHRAALAERGLIRPGLAPSGRDAAPDEAQRRFAASLAGKAAGGLDPEAAARLAGLWAEAAAARGATVLLSAEALHRAALRAGDGGGWRAARARYLDRLAAALAGFEVRPLLILRRPDDALCAQFAAAAARSPAPADFAGFRARVARDGARRAAEDAALLAERFGAPLGLVYEDLPGGGGFAPAVLAALGVDVAGLAPVAPGHPGLDPAQITALLVLRRRLGDAAPPVAALRRRLRTPAAAALLAERLGPGPFDLWESAAVRDAWLAAEAPGIARLRAAVLPERAAPFPSPRPLAPPVPAFDADLEARLVELATAPAAKKPPAAGRAGRPAVARTPSPIPDFVVIFGAMKAGTTSLFHYLAAHPQIVGSRIKEPDFFAGRRSGRKRSGAQYFSLWPGFDPARHRYALEASPSYSKFPMHGEAPARMARFAAERGARFKLIYIVRDPVDRIESHVAHNIARRPQRPPGGDFAHPIAVSRYASQLDRFLRRFPREDLLVLDFDDLRADPRALVGRALGFLGLEIPPDFAVRPPANPRRDAHGAAEFRLDADQRALLRAALRDDVAALRDRFGLDVAKWNIL